MRTILDLVEESSKWGGETEDCGYFSGTLSEMRPEGLVLVPMQRRDPSLAYRGSTFQYVIATKLGTEFYDAVEARFPGTRLIKVLADLDKPIRVGKGIGGWHEAEFSATDILSSLETQSE